METIIADAGPLVAAAAVIGAKEFVTFDQRQAALARTAGLDVKP